MHYARIILDPKWWGKGQDKDKEFTIGFQKIHGKFFLNVQNQTNIETQFVHYRNMEGLFVDFVTFLVLKEMFAHTWWSSYGSKNP